MKDEFDPDAPDDEIEIVSKSQLKREMLALQELAVYITQLNPEQRAKLPLSAELERGIDETKNIKKREALRRHHQFLGKLMRSADHEAIQAAVDKMKDKQDRLVRLLHVMEQWRDELIDGDQQVIERFFDEFPQADRQQLRNLVRNAKRERPTQKPPTNARKLFRYIRDLMANSDNEEGSYE